jgi:crotonobetainyl-CoA:carnitine CoA-transferase CaiB-like acyl-CoA transferase
MERFESAGVPCAPALTRREAIAHSQVSASGTIVELSHPTAGRLRQARPAAQFSATPPVLRLGAPKLGEHNTEVLMELGLSKDTIAGLRSAMVIGSEQKEDEDVPAL